MPLSLFKNSAGCDGKSRWLLAFAGMTLFCLGLSSVWAADTSPKVDPSLCRALTKHTPDASVAYQPGVDVHGKPVAPADVAGTPDVQMPQTFTIPLTVSLAKVLNLNTSQYPYSQIGPSTEAVIGTITVNGDQVFLNGKPLSDTQQDNLSVLCMKPK